MKTRFAFVLLAGLALSGCIEKRQPASAGGSAPEPAKTAPSQPAPQPAPADDKNAFEKYAKTLSTAPAKAAATVDIVSIQKAVQQFNAMEGRYPASLDELVSMRYLPAIPPVPHGKRLNYDPKTGSITLVDG